MNTSNQLKFKYKFILMENEVDVIISDTNHNNIIPPFGFVSCFAFINNKWEPVYVPENKIPENLRKMRLGK